VARSVRTFDVFDTLIARRSVEPHCVLERLEARAGLPGLAAVRLAADRQLWAAGQPFSLADLWRETGRALGLDGPTTSRLMDLEVQLEHEEVIPIADNLALVRDGDLLISDTYLPADIVWSLLHKAGLKRQVALVVSNDGKSRGWIWPEVLRIVTVAQHLGDNRHADGQSAAAAGVPAALTTLAQRSPVERLLAERGLAALANLVREARLGCTFPTTDPRGARHGS
jgi:predicted HAD superfamily hydrolase